ncbi:alpha-amylase family glycosyl hydrolase, partial [Polyangium fumosum]
GAGGSGGVGGSGAGGSGAGGSGGGDAFCPTVFTFVPPSGATAPRVPGEWQGFDLATAPVMSGPDANGAYKATVLLPPGLHGYKLVYQDANGSTQWILDQAQGRRKYLGGIENSAVKVRDCSLPTLSVKTTKATRTAPGQGAFTADLGYVDGADASGADATGFEVTLLEDGTKKPLAAPMVTVSPEGNVLLSLAGLADGKYRVTLRPRSKSGRVGEPVHLPFWIEAEPFSWNDAVVYMVLTDRYRDGDPSNNAPQTPGADARGDWKGGDLVGLRQSIEEGELDKLGIRAIWLTPFQTNPEAAFLAADGVHKVTGYHGYWPIKAREVDPRLGGPDALRALVKAAHAHGIRILQDYVVNHVHSEHEYFKSHPEWFRTGCVCGTANCDWTAKALECLFADYMPDINHSVPEANAQFVDDAVWWLDEFDLDGLRVDAVKHVEELATRNLSVEVRETFEKAGTHYFMMGETAMGWNDCGDPCNDENYGTIARYIGPFGLDGQFDFVLYHGVSYRTFAYGDKGMLHADYWTQHGLQKWPKSAIMTPYIGSHDTPRFVSLADYADGDRGIPGNQWDNTALAPSDAVPYERMRVAMAWLLALPGAPLMYYGDEYGQWGGADPNNRLMWRPENGLSTEEKATLTFVRKLGTARQAIPALRRGEYVSLGATEDTLVIGRKLAGATGAIVAFTRSAAPAPMTVDAATLGFAAGTVLKDAMGGPNVTVPAGGMLTLTVPAKSAIVLSP